MAYVWKALTAQKVKKFKFGFEEEEKKLSSNSCKTRELQIIQNEQQESTSNISSAEMMK